MQFSFKNLSVVLIVAFGVFARNAYYMLKLKNLTKRLAVEIEKTRASKKKRAVDFNLSQIPEMSHTMFSQKIISHNFPTICLVDRIFK